MKNLRLALKDLSEKILNPVVVLLNKLQITPNTLTWTGFIITLSAIFFIVKEKFVAAGIIILIGGIFDILDGTLARKMNKKTKFGGFLDSTIDRLSESALYLAIIIFFINNENKYGIILSYLVLVFSFLTSYMRARAGGIKIDCSIGFFTRTERIIVLVLGLFFNKLFDALVLILFFAFFTVIQRFIFVYKKTQVE